MESGYNWPSGFRGESVDGRRRTTETAYPIRSPGASGSSKLHFYLYSRGHGFDPPL